MPMSACRLTPVFGRRPPEEQAPARHSSKLTPAVITPGQAVRHLEDHPPPGPSKGDQPPRACPPPPALTQGKPGAPAREQVTVHGLPPRLAGGNCTVPEERS